MADHHAADVSTLTEREAARERLKASIDALADRANLQLQMQKEPAKLLGGASAVGAVIGLVIGRQFRRSKKIYVDARSPEKHQKALVKAQKAHKGGRGVGGALVATLGTLAVKTLTDRVLAPKLEELANSLLEKAGEAPGNAPKAAGPKTSARRAALPGTPASAARSVATAPASPAATASFLKSAPPPDQAESYNQQADAAGSAPPIAASHEHPGVVPTPKSVVTAKAQGSAIAPEEKSNPNLR